MHEPHEMHNISRRPTTLSDVTPRVARRRDDDDRRERERRREREKTDREKRRERYREEWRRLNDRHKRRATPWLLIRYTLLDMGLRLIPAGDTFWLSPDIWVESSDPFGNAVAGEENFIHARIFNLGKTTSAPTKVDFFWADPSLGLGPGNFNHIGTEWVEVFEHTAKYVRCNTPWIPKYLNNGHECLMVHCTNPILDPLMQPFQPTLDRHVGQRNIAVVKAKAGEMFELSLSLNNLFPLTSRTLVHARVEHVALRSGKLERRTFPQMVNHIVAYGKLPTNTQAEMMMRFRENTTEFRQAQKMAGITATRPKVMSSDTTNQNVMTNFFDVITTRAGYTSSAACINARSMDHTCSVQHGTRAHMGQFLSALDKLSPSAQLVDNSRDTLLHEDVLAPFEQRRLMVQMGVPGDAKRDEFVVFHLTQKTEGLLVGGYTVVAYIAAGVTR
jgi:hypothetical protein